MEVCVWQDDGYERSFVTDPSAVQVEAALRSLNGDDRNDLYLGAASGPWMGFGGGPDQVLVTYSESEARPHYQASPSGDPDTVELVGVRVGGQDVELSPRDLIDIDQAIPAALQFLETGDLPARLEWEIC